MREKVKEGYEEGDYEGDYREGREVRGKEKELFEGLFDKISGPEVLDLGCGTGLPFDHYFVDQGFEVKGLDISEKHVKKAKENVPEAEFFQRDFFEKEFGDDSFDAVVSFYAIFHIPREEHEKLFTQIREWVKDDGAVLLTLGPEKMDEHRGEIGGEEMLWSSYSPEKNLELLKESGFKILETYTEDYREETHFWVLAQPE